MTAIAYKAGVMAADSMSCESENGMIHSLDPKIYRLKSGAMIGLAGDSDSRSAIALLDDVRTREQLPTALQVRDLQQTISALLVLPDESVWYVYCGADGTAWKGSIAPLMHPNQQAIGCGAYVAIGAMIYGASAVEAIECACKASRFCSPPIQHMVLAHWKKPKRGKKGKREKRGNK